MTLVEFLQARLDEDERAAQAGQHSQVATMVAKQSGKQNVLNFWHRHDPARVLAEVDAKRRILDTWECENQDRDRHVEGETRAWLMDEVLQALALPYASHPDYRQAWRPRP